MTAENKFFTMSVIVVLIVAAIVSFSYLKPKTADQTPVNNSLTNNQATAVTYTISEVALHNNPSDCWEVINGKVYDLTKAIPIHPGGPETMSQFCGQDATAGFSTRNGNGPHPKRAQDALVNFYIGNLK